MGPPDSPHHPTLQAPPEATRRSLAGFRRRRIREASTVDTRQTCRETRAARSIAPVRSRGASSLCKARRWRPRISYTDMREDSWLVSDGTGVASRETLYLAPLRAKGERGANKSATLAFSASSTSTWFISSSSASSRRGHCGRREHRCARSSGPPQRGRHQAASAPVNVEHDAQKQRVPAS